MNEHVMKITKMRMEKTKSALERNNMQVFLADTKEQVPEIVKSLISKEDLIGSGGSASLQQSGVMDMLKNDRYKLLDRADYTPETMRDFYIKCFKADAYFTSANAITENGELYNVDGNSNRIAAIAFGPKSVIVVAGVNKLVKNLDDAVKRVKTIAAPANTVRLSCDTYCNAKGECKALACGSDDMTSGCGSDGRICCNFLVSAHQRHKNRIKVILVAEELGF